VRVSTFFIGMFWCVTALASHSYGGLDLCTLYPEVMPPGMQPKDLPQPESRGAILLQTYCSQCHALPGPGRHTAGEWHEVLDRMNLLMDVTSRFGGLMVKVKVPGSGDEELLRAYLTGNALQAMQGEPAGMGAAAFTSHCGSCHALPDAGQHSLEEWPAVLKRMQRNMTVMKYSPPSRELMLQIQYFLEQNLQTGPDTVPAGAAPVLSGITGDSGFNTSDVFDSGRWMALGPFLLLVFVGLARWWQGRVRP
jgi:mono/diheme cytochrome c family protein